MYGSEKQYGLIKGIFEGEIKAECSDNVYRAYPHFNFLINSGNAVYEVNINVFNRVKGHPELRVFTTFDPLQDLINTITFTKAIQLSDGVYMNVGEDLALDYLRGNYFDLNRFQVPFGPVGEKEEDFLIQLFRNQISQAREHNYRFCIWGNCYQDGSGEQLHFGIHDIHQNQGSSNTAENKIWNDGALLIVDNTTIKFACFLGFITQCLSTDNYGNCKG